MDTLIYKTLAECATLEVSQRILFIHHAYTFDREFDQRTVYWSEVVHCAQLSNQYSYCWFSIESILVAIDRRGLGATIGLGGPNDVSDWWEDILRPIFIIGHEYYVCTKKCKHGYQFTRLRSYKRKTRNRWM